MSFDRSMKGKDDYYFFGTVHPPQMGDSEGKTHPNVFRDEDVPKMNLEKVPIIHEHNTKLSLGGVIVSPKGSRGEKIIGGWIDGKDPVSRYAIDRIQSGDLTELSMTHAFIHGNGPDASFDHIRMPFEISLTKKAARKGCKIFYGGRLPSPHPKRAASVRIMRNSRREISDAHSEPEKGGSISTTMEGEKTQTEGAPSEDHSQQQQQEGGDATEPTPAKEEDLDLQMEQITNLPPEDQKRVSLEMLKLIRDLKDQKDELLKKADNLERNQESVKKQYEEETKKIENRLLEIVKNGSPEGESEGLVAETKESLKKITEGDHEDFDRLRARNQVFGQLLKNSDTFAAENERLKLELEASKKEPNRLETILQGFDSYRGNRYSPYDRFPKDQAKGAEREDRSMGSGSTPASTSTTVTPPPSNTGSTMTMDNSGGGGGGGGERVLMPKPGSQLEAYANKNPEKYYEAQARNPGGENLLEHILKMGNVRPKTY